MLDIRKPSEFVSVAGSLIVALPFSLAYIAGEQISEVISDEFDKRKRWHVTGVRKQGDKTAVELRSEDGKRKLDMAVETKSARAHGLQVRDQIDIERVGKAGFAVKKGEATIGVLAQPGSGMVHSTPRT